MASEDAISAEVGDSCGVAQLCDADDFQGEPNKEMFKVMSIACL